MENICIAYNKNKKTKCTIKAQQNTSFCGYHKNSEIIKTQINNKVEEKFNYCKFLKKYYKIKKKCNKKRYLSRYYFLLDKFYKENLLSIMESFKEIEIKNIILIDNKPWDINLLLDLWGNAICSTEMQNPLPVFPANPFTRKNISIKDFKNISNMIEFLKIKLYEPLKYLFINCEKVFNYKVDGYNTNKLLSQHLIKIINEKYRFRLLNIKNSQDCYIGIWVNKDYSMSDFEVFFDYYDKIPIQIQNAFGSIYDNPEKTQIKYLLDNYPKENSISIYDFYN
jgi:hypothetical protein